MLLWDPTSFFGGLENVEVAVVILFLPQDPTLQSRCVSPPGAGQLPCSAAVAAVITTDHSLP